MKSIMREIVENILRNKWRFALWFIAVFFMTFLILSAFGFIPEDRADTRTQTVAATGEEFIVTQPELPVRVASEEVGLDTSVVNPAARDIAALNDALLGGAVRYPSSALLNQSGNVLLFGHSSHLPVVSNSAYKAFNDIEDLERGELIRVESEATVYLYRVTNISKVNATAAGVPLNVGEGRRLTLVTCDNFGAVEERFVVEAEFAASYPLSS